MRVYIAHVIQDQDYDDQNEESIGCNETVWALNADNVKDAIQELEEYILEYASGERIVEATLYKVGNTMKLSPDEIYKKFDNK